MGDVTVTLTFGDHLVQIPCEAARVPTDTETDIPVGYVQIESAVGFEPANGGAGSMPEIRGDATMLVSDEHVAMIQREG